MSVARPIPASRASAASAGEALLERLRRGDPAAFDEFVAAHQARVRRLASRLLGWSGDVEDIVQEVFVAALVQLPRFRGDSALATWLAAITLHKCRGHQRRWRRGLRAMRKLVQRQPPPADAAALHDETTQRVRQAVRSLPPAQREVVVLYYLEDWTTAQISELLNVAPGTIDVRLHRARQRLRDKLADIQ